MMKHIVYLSLIWTSFVHGQVQFQNCPMGWDLFGEHCYKFVGYPRVDPNAASSYCQMDGGALVSVNTEAENSFIINWLELRDANRDTWLTSGIRNADGVQWLGDGTSTTGFLYFTNFTAGVFIGGTVVFYFTGTEYRWGMYDATKNSSFICEIPLSDIYKIVDEGRGFDYGLNVDPSMVPKGPKFLVEPVETTITSDTPTAYLDCLATALPEAAYMWLKGPDGSLQEVKGDRYFLVGGRLAIQGPMNADVGTYQCKASNPSGSILSRPVSLSFGTIGEFSNVASADVSGQMYNGAVLNCPTITFKPAISYQWFKNSVLSFIRPEFQTHTFISNNGKLYFSELSSSDDALYYCVVTLTSLGTSGNYLGANRDISRTSKGFRLNVQKGAGSNYRPDIQDDFILVYPPNPKRGQRIQLECFAYGTGPLIYSWFRDGRDMPRTKSLSNNNRVLTIDNVQLEDGGQYRCRVDSTSSGLFDTKNFTLDIQAEPYFTYPLTDQQVDINSRLSWHAEARGKPAPTYTWYKDSVPLKNSTNMTIIGNTMIIDRLSPEMHNGMYQCRAQNLYGVTFTTAQIRVLGFAPTFVKYPLQPSISATVGGNVTIVCKPEAAPGPTYQWFRNNADLQLQQGGAPSNGYQMLLNGNLFITNVQLSHQGNYTCKVTNSFGTNSSSGLLRVYATTVISQRPQNVAVEVNTTATLVCSSSSPPNIDVVYVWYFNNHLVDFFRDPNYRMGSGPTSGNLFIIGTQYRHEGQYTCVVTTGQDSISASAMLTVRGPPGEPVGVYQGDNSGQDSKPVSPRDRIVQIYWSDGDTHGSAINYYTVEFHTNFDPTWRVQPDADRLPVRDVLSVEFPDKRMAYLSNLKPGAKHQFRVRAINNFGIGIPSMPTDEISVPGTAPVVAPKGVSGGGGSVGDLTITWQPVPLEDYSGDNYKYIVMWRERASNPMANTSWSRMELDPSVACGYRLDTLKGLVLLCRYVALVGADKFYSPYEVRLQGRNQYGLGVMSDIVFVMSAEQMPTGTPRRVYALSYNSTALMVFWTPVPNTRMSVNGKLLGYKVMYWLRGNETEDRSRFTIINVPPGQDNIDHGLVIGLLPNTWYAVMVQAYTSAGYGPKSEYYYQETFNDAPTLYPTEVHVYSIEGVGLRVNFRGISTNALEEPLQGYKVHYWPVGDNIRNAVEVDVGRGNDIVITNVTRSKQYQLRVYGYSRGGQGKQSSPAVYFTVGEGQIIFNPETTELMAGASYLRLSFLNIVLTCGLVIFLWHL